MIYEPAEDSYLLSEQVKKLAFGKVLDLGTGSGIQAFEAAKLKKVKSVLAVDVSDEVVNSLKNKLKTKHEQISKHRSNSNSKITLKKSDLFQNVKGRFDIVIFNPPYLPRDKREPLDSALATTGGKHGYETLRRFFNGLNDHLTKNGIALIVFSSLTNKSKVDEFIITSGFIAELLKEEKISFETLYCYKIRRNWLFDELFTKNVTSIRELAKGHRGLIFTGLYKRKKIAIKVQRLDLKIRTVDREALMIKRINKSGIAPKILFKGKNYFAYEFAEGESIFDFLEHSKKEETKKVFLETLRQCRVLDNIHITKEEMTNPYKHVIIGKKIILIDFERAHYDPKPQNVTQFCQYLIKNREILSKKDMNVKKEDFIALTKQYKNDQSESNYNKIRKSIEVL